MAALTFNPLVLSAKASVRGAAVRRSVAVKASKKAAFAVRADDDMDFVSGVPGPFSFLPTPERRAWRPTARASSARASRDRRDIFRPTLRANPRRSRRLPPPARDARALRVARSDDSRRAISPTVGPPRHPVVVATDPRALPLVPSLPLADGRDRSRRGDGGYARQGCRRLLRPQVHQGHRQRAAHRGVQVPRLGPDDRPGLRAPLRREVRRDPLPRGWFHRDCREDQRPSRAGGFRPRRPEHLQRRRPHPHRQVPSPRRARHRRHRRPLSSPSPTPRATSPRVSRVPS